MEEILLGLDKMRRPLRVAVYGAGIAGLTCADTLAKLGHAVDVYEPEAIPGGVARSQRRAKDGVPGEYSWRGFGPSSSNLIYPFRFDTASACPAQKRIRSARARGCTASNQTSR